MEVVVLVAFEVFQDEKLCKNGFVFILLSVISAVLLTAFYLGFRERIVQIVQSSVFCIL